MPQRVKIGALAVLLFAAGWLSIHHFRRQPQYQGKTAAEWFQELCAASPRYQRPATHTYMLGGSNVLAYTTDNRSWLSDPAAVGLRALGTNAALYLAKLICHEDPSWAPAYWKLFQKLPRGAKFIVPNPPASHLIARF